MTSLLSVIPMVARRVATNAPLLVAITVGAVLAAALMSTTSIYTNAIRDLGLSFALREAGADDTNILIRTAAAGSEEATQRKNRQFIESAVDGAIGAIVAGQTSAARSATFFPTAPGAPVAEDEGRPRAHFQFFSGLEAQVEIGEGRLPRPAAFDGTTAPDLEVAVGGAAARATGLRLGDRFDLHPFWLPEAAPVHVTIVGILEPVDETGPYWFGLRDVFLFETPGWATFPFFVPEATFFEAIAAYLPTMSSDFWQLVYLDTSRISPANAESVRLSVQGLSRQIESNVLRTSARTELPRTLATYDEKLFFTRIPLLVLVLQIAAIVLYYLFMVATMLVERQAGEIALLKSRGATTRQIMQVYLVEGLTIAAIGLALGPPLAAGVISLLGQTPPFADLSGGANLSVSLSGTAYLWAASGAVLALAALLWPAYQATKRTMVQQKVASVRPQKQPFITRYYVDVVVVEAAALLLLYQLDRQGGLVTERLFGERAVDPILLTTPALFVLAAGYLFLRLFPLVLGGLATILARVQGTAVLIGMWQLVRNPSHYSRLVLLLMLATAVGTFAASFGATVSRSYRDRAEYEAGAPIRLASLRSLDAAGPADLAATVASELGAESVSPVARLTGSAERLNFDIIGVDPASLGDVAYFRGDFASGSLSSILGKLAEDETPAAAGIALPADARWLGVWLNPVDLNGRSGLAAKLRDATGRYFIVDLGPTEGAELAPGWSFLIGDLSAPRRSFANLEFATSPPQAPLALESLAVRFISRVSLGGGTIQVDDLQTSATPGIVGSGAAERLLHDPERRSLPFPAGTLIEDYVTDGAWEAVQGLTLDLADEVRTIATPAGTAAELSWRPVRGRPQTHGLWPRAAERPVAVLASRRFLASPLAGGSGLAVGDTTTAFIGGSYIELEIAGSFDLFPTLADTRSAPALVANLDRLVAAINRSPRAPIFYADEAWLTAGAETEALARSAVATGAIQAQIVSFEAIKQAQDEDPLVAAGWEGILFISFAAILLLSAIGFLIYSYLTAQRRTLEFAVLRTMGFSRRQIASVVGFEQAFVIGLGMAAGTVFGLYLGRLMIRYMGLTETGDEALPPLVLEVSWLTVGAAWLVLGLAFLVTIGIVVLLYWRLALHRVLRIGET